MQRRNSRVLGFGFLARISDSFASAGRNPGLAGLGISSWRRHRRSRPAKRRARLGARTPPSARKAGNRIILRSRGLARNAQAFVPAAVSARPPYRLKDRKSREEERGRRKEKTLITQLSTWNQKPETRNQEPETRNPLPIACSAAERADARPSRLRPPPVLHYSLFIIHCSSSQTGRERLSRYALTAGSPSGIRQWPRPAGRPSNASPRTGVSTPA